MIDQGNTSKAAKRIIVIDDHILFRDGVVSLFRSTPDFKVVGEAGSVHEGIASAREFQPDIIIMDFSLPDGTGLEATQTILAEMPACKIIFLTVHETDDKLFAAIRAGAKGYIAKNVAGQTLISSLRALEHDEMAISRKTASRIIEEFSHTSEQSMMSDEIIAKLSPRELEVLLELEPGVTNNEIAQRLYISENTVKHHIRTVLEKLGARNRREANQIAVRAGLMNDHPENNGAKKY